MKGNERFVSGKAKTMHRFRSKQDSRAQPEYATCADFCEHFVNDLKPLYVLAFLLTGSHAEAEQCFVATVDDVVKAKGVFKGWERSWNKRRLIINAIRRMFPGPAANQGKDTRLEVDEESREQCSIDAVLRLAPPLQRFVFVISVLEKYSEHECALLLGCAPRDVREARIYALGQLSGNPAPAKIAG